MTVLFGYANKGMIVVFRYSVSAVPYAGVMFIDMFVSPRISVSRSQVIIMVLFTVTFSPDVKAKSEVLIIFESFNDREMFTGAQMSPSRISTKDCILNV